MADKTVRGEVRTLSMPGAGPTGGQDRHSLQVFNREQVLIEGVVAVETFDDVHIILETNMGTLTLKGEDLQIKQLDLETGKFAVDGFVSSCVYSTPRQRGGRAGRSRSFLERLLR